MPTNFAICRTKKIKSWSTLTKSVGHNLRTSADSRSHLNGAAPEALRIIDGNAEWLTEWRAQVDGMHLRKLSQGCQHTLAREFFLGVSPTYFEGKSKREINQWAKDNVQWLHDRFGKDRVKLAVLHLDEQTPHIAAYVVGLKADKNLSRGNGWTLSDSVLGLGGNKSSLSQLQDEYAKAMEHLKLQRGIKGSKATHQSTAAWRRQMAKPLDTSVSYPKPIEPTLADRINIEAYGKRVAEAAATDVHRQMKPYHQQAKAQARQLKAQTKELSEIRTKLALLEPLADAFKRLLELLLGREPNLGSLQGIKDAQEAVHAFAKAVIHQPEAVQPAEPAPLPERPATGPARQRAGRSPSP